MIKNDIHLIKGTLLVLAGDGEAKKATVVIRSASPTMSTAALMLTLITDALEGRDVATADVVGAYLNAIMPDYVLIKLTGEAVKIMCDVNPKYSP
jgi:hypothetical protein